MTDDDTLSNSVGYKNPPRNKQFKPGQSGNPKGRPKGATNIATELDNELNSLITITENGKRKRISKRRAIVKQTVNGAVSGDPKSVKIVLDETRQREEQIRSGFSITEDIPIGAEDKPVMESILRRIRASTPGPLESASAASPQSEACPAPRSEGEAK